MIAHNSGETVGTACSKALEPVVGTALDGLLGECEVTRVQPAYPARQLPSHTAQRA